MIKSFKNDYQFGTQEEEKILNTINNYFKDNIKKVADKLCKYDFKGDNYIYELKSRNNKYETFPTTLIGKSKILKDSKQIFLFNFTDGLYYIEYDKYIFDSFKLDYFCRFRRSDYKDEAQLYYFIPIESLRPIIKTKANYVVLNNT